MTHEQIEYRNYVLQGMASYGGDVAQALVWYGNHFTKLSNAEINNVLHELTRPF
ncbi:hypothetical protein ABGN28_08420 [Levilactobacillus brevis]|uniref:hypothetical protein n=1 Tax=Levilactobacillus brevis TaxID=1580 RepID=UPI00325C1DC8